jgi:hypothetical protein
MHGCTYVHVHIYAYMHTHCVIVCVSLSLSLRACVSLPLTVTPRLSLACVCDKLLSASVLYRQTQELRRTRSNLLLMYTHSSRVRVLEENAIDILWASSSRWQCFVCRYEEWWLFFIGPQDSCYEIPQSMCHCAHSQASYRHPRTHRPLPTLKCPLLFVNQNFGS